MEVLVGRVKIFFTNLFIELQVFTKIFSLRDFFVYYIKISKQEKDVVILVTIKLYRYKQKWRGLRIAHNNGLKALTAGRLLKLHDKNNKYH
jgi:hypothetical protein